METHSTWLSYFHITNSYSDDLVTYGFLSPIDDMRFEYEQVLESAINGYDILTLHSTVFLRQKQKKWKDW